MTTQEEKQDELLSSNEEEEEEEEEEEVVEAPKKRGRKPKQKNQKKQKLDESALKTFDLVLFKAALSGVGLASNGALLDGPADAALKDAVTCIFY